jgi:MoaA/NifB/PqqE/SkfB family radical SAM enzyme
VRPANLALLAARALRSRAGRPGAPYKLNWILTERCNLRCASCRVWEAPRRELSLDEIRAFLGRAHDFSWVDLSGGEIFLREDLGEIVAAVVASCRRLALLHFPTNGWFTDRVVALVRDTLARPHPRVVVTVSVDGPPALHDHLRGSAGSFARAAATFARLRELRGCDVSLGMTLTAANAGRLEETLAAVRRVAPGTGWRDLHLNVAQRSPHYYRNPELPPPPREAVAADLRLARSRRGLPRGPLDLLERRYLALAARWVETGRAPARCRALAATCFLAADGTVYPCLTWDRSLGSLRETGYDLAPIWDAPGAREAREAIRRGACPGCWTACEAFPALV